MQELMIHVERIVRPVCATQRRKLTMRRELMAHLETTLAEEEQRDRAGALDRAKKRLGDPLELTRQLQASVPFYQRLLLGRVPAAPGVDKWERDSAERWWGMGRPMTMGHSSIFILTAMSLLFLPGLLVFTLFKPASGYPVTLPDNPTLYRIVAGLTLFLVWFLFCYALRFLGVITAAFERKLTATRAWRSLVFFIALQVTLMNCITYVVMRRPATLGESAASVLAILVLTTLMSLIAAGVARLRARFDEWMTLDLRTESP
jgi:hypothetical protein